MSELTTIANDLVVGIEYKLTLDDGELLDQSNPGEPLYFLQGHGNIIPGLEKEMIGLTIGHEKEVTVSPEEGYGVPHPENFQKIPKTAFPPEALPTLLPGMPLQLNNPETGEMFQASITEILEDGVVVDLNHPLAGETLHFWVKVVAIREASAEEIEHGHAH